MIFHQRSKLKQIFESSNIADIQNQLIALIKNTEDVSTLKELIKVTSRTTIENLVDDLALSNAGKKIVFDTIFSNKRVQIEDALDFLNKCINRNFDTALSNILLKEGVTKFDDLKKIHPFLEATLDDLISVKDKSGQSGAGPGEFIFRMLGATEPKKGDLSFNGSIIEVKANSGYLSVRGKSGFFLYNPKYKNKYPELAKIVKSSLQAKHLKRIELEYDSKKFDELLLDVFDSTFLQGKTVFKKYKTENTSKFNEDRFNNFIIREAFIQVQEEYEIDSLLLVGRNSKEFVTITSSNSPFLDVSAKKIAFIGLPQILQRL